MSLYYGWKTSPLKFRCLTYSEVAMDDMAVRKLQQQQQNNITV